MAQRDLRRVRAKADKVKQAEQELRTAIVAALDSGESYRDVAPYAGLSYARVHEIAKEARRERGESA